MSAARYIEFDSTYRNRTLYELPSDFTVQMAQTGSASKLAAQDPVSEASPVLVWNNTLVEYSGPPPLPISVPANIISNITASDTSAVPFTQGSVTFEIVTQEGNPLRQVRNFYVGSCLSINPGGGGVVSRRIIEYLPLATYKALITLDSPFPDSYMGLTTFYIINPTPFPTNAAGENVVKTWIPGSNDCVSANQQTQTYGLGGDNYYIGYYIMNLSSGQSFRITAFDAPTRLATLDGKPTTDWSAMSDGKPVNFVIRKELPLENGSGVGSAIVALFGNRLQLANSSNSRPTGTYDGDFLRINPAIGSSSPYDITTDSGYEAKVVTTYPTNCQNQERQIKRYVYGQGTVIIVSGVNLVLDSSASSVDGAYTNSILTINQGGDDADPSFPRQSYSAVVSSYTGSTRTAVLATPVTVAPGNTWYIKTATLTSPFEPAPVRGNLYEIEAFSRDNYNPFIYTGSMVSSQESVCYEVELLNLIIPNSLLASGRGGRPIYYPYLYVMFQPVSSDTSANKNVIYSNNPNSYGMLYRAVVDDTPIPAISPFIKIDGDGMVHVIKFKPNTSFRFGVFHADGEPFRTVFEDHYSPTAPNPLAQISACFAFKRVS
jgi:hypothetical protein